ncbi:hypothetical protein BURPS1710b_0155 [Burkholderia pseudomallei 1710b]|uniref:Uncharacterized protein n=1 Tax=Burkholderia pseudomallei (strain 1710b) TaxID=320372 RepID=Q3JXY3_BURP1|nr:hypothetical protein BURPS1710b_0155 [Burkholderia pseudomallei 1710b]
MREARRRSTRRTCPVQPWAGSCRNSAGAAAHRSRALRAAPTCRAPAAATRPAPQRSRRRRRSTRRGTVRAHRTPAPVSRSPRIRSAPRSCRARRTAPPRRRVRGDAAIERGPHRLEADDARQRRAHAAPELHERAVAGHAAERRRGLGERRMQPPHRLAPLRATRLRDAPPIERLRIPERMRSDHARRNPGRRPAAAPVPHPPPVRRAASCVVRSLIARPASLRRDVDVAEVLAAERLHGAVRLQFVDRGIQARLQHIIALAQPERDAAAENLVVAHRRPDEREALRLRPRQEAALARRREHERAVEAARREVRIRLVLILVRDHLHARARPVRIRIRLLNRTLQHAHPFALQRCRRRLEAAVRARDQLRRHAIDHRREIDRLTALVGCVHRGIDRIELAALQRRNQPVERRLDPFARELRCVADGVADVDIEALQRAVRRLRFERRILRLEAEAQRLRRVGARRAGPRGGAQCTGEREPELQSFHRCFSLRSGHVRSGRHRARQRLHRRRAPSTSVASSFEKLKRMQPVFAPSA